MSEEQHKQGLRLEETEVLAPSSDRDGGAIIESLTRSEIQVQQDFAAAHPRSVTKFRAETTALATYDQETAASCIYGLPRGGKTIHGPSIRFAEIIISTWGNCRAGSRVIEEGERFVTAQGIFLDLERNTFITSEVRRRITDSKGKRYNDDMIVMTANAACSIALRNAVFRAVPKAFWEPVYKKTGQCATGGAKPLGTRVQDCFDYFAKMGVSKAQCLNAVGKTEAPQITEDDLVALIGIATAIKDGDTTIERAFPPPELTQKTAEKTVTVPQQQAAKKEEPKPAAAAQKPAEAKKEPQKPAQAPAQTPAQAAKPKPAAAPPPPPPPPPVQEEAPPPEQETEEFVVENAQRQFEAPEEAQEPPETEAETAQEPPEEAKTIVLDTDINLGGKIVPTAGITAVAYAKVLKAEKVFSEKTQTPAKEAFELLFPGLPDVFHLTLDQANQYINYLNKSA